MNETGHLKLPVPLHQGWFFFHPYHVCPCPSITPNTARDNKRILFTQDTFNGKNRDEGQLLIKIRLRSRLGRAMLPPPFTSSGGSVSGSLPPAIGSAGYVSSRQPAPLQRTGPGVSGQIYFDPSGKYSYWRLRWAYSPGTQTWNGSLNVCFALGQAPSLQSTSTGCGSKRPRISFTGARGCGLAPECPVPGPRFVPVFPAAAASQPPPASQTPRVTVGNFTAQKSFVQFCHQAGEFKDSGVSVCYLGVFTLNLTGSFWRIQTWDPVQTVVSKCMCIFMGKNS